MHRNTTPRANTQPQSRTDQETPAHHVTHDFDGPARLTTTLAHAVSDIADIDVTDAELAINTRVDPDALDRLFKPDDAGHTRTGGRLEFDLWAYRVTIHGNGNIAVQYRQPAQQGRTHPGYNHGQQPDPSTRWRPW